MARKRLTTWMAFERGGWYSLMAFEVCNFCYFQCLQFSLNLTLEGVSKVKFRNAALKCVILNEFLYIFIDFGLSKYFKTFLVSLYTRISNYRGLKKRRKFW